MKKITRPQIVRRLRAELKRLDCKLVLTREDNLDSYVVNINTNGVEASAPLYDLAKTYGALKEYEEAE